MKSNREELKCLGARVKRQRLALGLTQHEMAQKVDVNINYIGMLERGERNPSYLTLKKIADRLSLTVAELMP